jgi:hypothetical protein
MKTLVRRTCQMNGTLFGVFDLCNWVNRAKIGCTKSGNHHTLHSSRSSPTKTLSIWEFLKRCSVSPLVHQQLYMPPMFATSKLRVLKTTFCEQSIISYPFFAYANDVHDFNIVLGWDLIISCPVYSPASLQLSFSALC